MNRAVIVLLLLIANAILSASRDNSPKAAPPARTDHSLGFFTSLDGAAPERGGPPCRTDEAAGAPFLAHDIRL